MSSKLRIHGASVFDGSGAPAEQADVVVEGDRIAAVGASPGTGGDLEIDAIGLALAPGFIDVHTHDDFATFLYPDMGFKLRGGVTTCVVGNCGFGPAPFAEACSLASAFTPGLELDPYVGFRGYFERLEHTQPGANIAVLAGHGTIRLAVLQHRGARRARNDPDGGARGGRARPERGRLRGDESDLARSHRRRGARDLDGAHL
jgi:N-acyl-D-aspartate/D-glutamate deacylase